VRLAASTRKMISTRNCDERQAGEPVYFCGEKF
jgi:hypothetical protein